MKILSYSILFLGISGCTDAQFANMTSLGSSGDIICYSGGQVIYQGRSTGKILTETQSDGWIFKDSNTGKLIRVSGDCLIQN